MNKEYEKVFTERGFTNIEQMATMFDYYKDEKDKYKNIIDELEEWLTKNISQINAYFDNTPFGVEDTYKEVLNKLKELKGSDE